MFSKLLELIKEALAKMFDKSNENNQLYKQIDLSNCVSNKMQTTIDTWLHMYQDDYVTEEKMSLGIPGIICSELARSVLLEFDSHISDLEKSDFNPEKDIPATRAQYLDVIYQTKIVDKLRDRLEYALAVGGMIIKPYLNGNEIAIDFSMQGEFVPLGFDDDGNIIDIAFYDSFIQDGKKYTKIERHIFSAEQRQVTVINKCFVTKNLETDMNELGKEVPLESVEKWAAISAEPVIINNTNQPLYGFFKTPKTNTVDLKSPLGASVFARAKHVIDYTNRHFSRLDFEYLAGSMAVDVDESLLDPNNPHGLFNLPESRRRVFRGLDTGQDDLYHVFAPNLRDESYIRGLNTYLMRIEDLCELSRGTLSDPNQDARTATEMLILKQRAYSNVVDNQKQLEKAIKAVVNSINTYVDLYNLFKPGDYEISFNWDDSIIVDKNAELEKKLQLMQENILSSAEVRAWYTGESLEEAQKNIDIIENSNNSNPLPDIFTGPAIPGEQTVEYNKKTITDEDIIE